LPCLLHFSNAAAAIGGEKGRRFGVVMPNGRSYCLHRIDMAEDAATIWDSFMAASGLLGDVARLGIGGAVVRRIILSARETDRKGVGGFTAETLGQQGIVSPFPQAEFERAQFDEFFKFFPEFPLKEKLKDHDVLDFGSGYGGKTVEYKVQCQAKRVCGVEPFDHVIAKSQQYAASRDVEGVEFKVCGHTEIPYPDASFDFVLSHDVLEHVQDPRTSLAEIRRVLRPGGLSFNVFPVYWGALSHHLDYIVKTPGLHWFFSPRTLVRAVNSVLAEDSQYGMAQQPEPKLSFDGSRRVLPTLNGLSGRHLKTLFDGFDVLSLDRRPLFWWRPRWGPVNTFIARSRLPAFMRDAVTGSIACVLRKP
jgi:SAM-dependent methyltransferase